MSTLIERYIHEVGRYLPPKDRDDIKAELRSLLQDKVEQREATSDEAIAAVLKEFGAPMKVAASYGGEHYIVSPAMYPTYLMVCKIGVAVMAGVQLILIVLAGSTSFSNLGSAMMESVAGFFSGSLAFIGSVTIVFAILERQNVNMEEMQIDWNPLELPAIDDPARVKRFETMVGVAFTLLWLFILNAFRSAGGLPIYYLPNVRMDVIPVAANVLWSLIGITSIQIVMDVVAVLQGRWSIPLFVARKSMDLAGAFVSFLGMIIPAINYVSTTYPAFAGFSELEFLVRLFFYFIIAITVIDSVVKLVKMVTRRSTLIPSELVVTPTNE